MTSQFPDLPLPGVLVFLFGVVWSWSYAAPKMVVGEGRASASERCWSRYLSPHPLGGLIKMGASTVGIAASLFVAYPDGTYRYVGDAHYVTIFVFFGLSGAADTVGHYAPHCVSGGLRRYAMAQAFFVEGLLLAAARGSADAAPRRAELLLVAAALACGVAAALHGVFPGLGAFRCASALVHGSWYVQSTVMRQLAALALAPNAAAAAAASSSLPPGDPEGQVLWISLVFAWHCAAAFLFLLLLVVARRRPACSGRSPPRGRHHSCPMCDVAAFQMAP